MFWVFTFVPDSNTSALPVNPALRNQPVEDHLAKSAPMQVYEVQGPLIVRRVQILSKIRSGLSNHLVRIPDLGLLLVKSGSKKHGR